MRPLAVFDIANGDFVLVPIDTKGTAEGALNAAEEAVAANVKLVIGPVFSDAVSAAAPPILEAGLNMLAFSNNSAVSEPGVYLSGLSPEAQIERVVRYAAAQGLQRIAALVPPGPPRNAYHQSTSGLRGNHRYKGQPDQGIRHYTGRNRRINKTDQQL